MLAFIGKPSIILLDEPFTAIDHQSVDKLSSMGFTEQEIEYNFSKSGKGLSTRGSEKKQAQEVISKITLL